MLTVEMDHRRWMERFHAWARGGDEAPAQPPELDSHDCAFGHWIDNDGERRYGHLKAFRDMIAVHAAVHDTGAALAAANATDANAALSRFAELQDASRALIEAMRELRLIAVGQAE